MTTRPPCKLPICCVLGWMLTLSAFAPPTLNFSLFVPGLAQLSWPTNYSGWQLMSATNLGPLATWQPVAGTPVPFNTNFVVFYQMTNQSCFFQLQQSSGGSGGGCFQAMPSTIAAGNSATLSWCADSDPTTVYQIQPGIGMVTGTNYVVSPPATTVYTLIASNSSGVVTEKQTEVDVVTPACNFVGAKGWNCTLTFDYEIGAASPDYNFTIHQQASLIFHLSPSVVSANSATFTGSLGGTASINDSETLLTTDPETVTTVVGSTLLIGDSVVHLHINCLSGTYSIDVTPVVDGIESQNGQAQPPPYIQTVGTLFIQNRSLPASFGSLSSAGTETHPAHSVAWSGGGDFYLPGNLGENLFLTGTVTESTGGNVTAAWTFTPGP
jgi:hypothetical protein